MKVKYLTGALEFVEVGIQLQNQDTAKGKKKRRNENWAKPAGIFKKKVGREESIDAKSSNDSTKDNKESRLLPKATPNQIMTFNSHPIRYKGKSQRGIKKSSQGEISDLKFKQATDLRKMKMSNNIKRMSMSGYSKMYSMAGRVRPQSKKEKSLYIHINKPDNSPNSRKEADRPPNDLLDRRGSKTVKVESDKKEDYLNIEIGISRLDRRKLSQAQSENFMKEIGVRKIDEDREQIRGVIRDKKKINGDMRVSNSHENVSVGVKSKFRSWEEEEKESVLPEKEDDSYVIQVIDLEK